MSWNTTKTNHRHNFHDTKFLVIDLVLTDKRNLSDTQPKLASGKSSSCHFCSQLQEMPLPKPLNM